MNLFLKVHFYTAADNLKNSETKQKLSTAEEVDLCLSSHQSHENSATFLNLPRRTSNSSSMPDLSTKQNCLNINSALESTYQPSVPSFQISLEKCEIKTSDNVANPSSEQEIQSDNSELLPPSQKLLELSFYSFTSTNDLSSRSDENISQQRKLRKSISCSPNVKRHCLGLPKSFLSPGNSFLSLRKSSSSNAFSNLIFHSNIKQQSGFFNSSRSCSLLNKVGVHKSAEPAFFRTRSLKLKKKASDPPLPTSKNKGFSISRHQFICSPFSFFN